jgi:hypothetical protein
MFTSPETAKTIGEGLEGLDGALDLEEAFGNVARPVESINRERRAET